MPTYLTDLLSRMAALEKEALLSIGVSADAKPYFYHTQESFPYFTNRIVDTPISDDGSQDTDLNSPVLIARLVVGHITEGYRGQPESKLYEWLPVLKTYIQERTQWLQSVEIPTRMDFLQSARVVNGGGLRAFQNDGIGVLQVGAEIQVMCTFYEPIDQIDY